MTPNRGLPSPSYFIVGTTSGARETTIVWETASHQATLASLKQLQVDRPLSVWELNTDEGTVRDVSEDFAQRVVDDVIDGDDYPAGSLLDFCEDHLGCEALAELARTLSMGRNEL